METEYIIHNLVHANSNDGNDIDILFRPKHPDLDDTFVVVAINLVLTEAIDLLTILRDINGANSPEFSKDLIKYQNAAQRYEGLEDHGMSRLTQKSGNYDKLANDINMIINILTEGKGEYKSGSSINVVKQSTKALKRMMEDDRKLLEDMETYEGQIEQLTKLCEEQRADNMKTIEDTNTKIQKLKFDVDDLIIYERLETKFYDQWEAARRDQNIMICDNKEKKFRNVIQETNVKIEQENRCHQEFEKFMHECSEDLKEDINYWMKNYDEELDKWDRNVMQIKSDTEKMIVDLADVKKLYATRKQQIADWLEYKKEKKLREEREAKELEAALVVQSWWRGIMVRKHLGPYKAKKGKKGKKKK